MDRSSLKRAHPSILAVLLSARHVINAEDKANRSGERNGERVRQSFFPLEPTRIFKVPSRSMLETSRLRLYSLPAKKCAACSATEGRREETEGKRKRVLYTYIHLYVRTCGVYIAIVPCFHSFAERSKELCRRGIKSLNDATMKEGSIGTRNCTVNTEKNIVTERRSNGGWREGCRQGWKELKRKGKDSENGKGKKGESRRSSIAGRKPSREGPIKVSASRRILEIRSPIDQGA